LRTGWFQFVRAQGDLTKAQERALDGRGADWFTVLERTPMSKSFKMVLLQVLLDAGALGEGLPIAELTSRSFELLHQDPRLHKDVEGVKALGGGAEPDPQRFPAYWKKNPINAWTQDPEWFREEDGGKRLVSLLPITPETRDAFHVMTQELVDYRLAEHFDSKRLDSLGDSLEARVSPSTVVPLPPRRALVAFPSLKAAAGAARDSLASAPEDKRVRLPMNSSGDALFAVRASGDSMNGGARPIRDGDWLVMRYVRGVGIGALDGHVALVRVPDASGHTYQVKRIVRQDDQWRLRSENPEYPPFDVTEDMMPIAQLVEIIPPERVGPLTGVLLEDEGIKKAFGLSTLPKTGRYGGHLFLCIDRRGLLDKPDRIKQSIPDRHPAETAFVLTRTGPARLWRYAGIAHWNENEGRWVLPEPVDPDTWEALGPAPEVG
jgi:hypothetical protein